MQPFGCDASAGFSSKLDLISLAEFLSKDMSKNVASIQIIQLFHLALHVIIFFLNCQGVCDFKFAKEAKKQLLQAQEGIMKGKSLSSSGGL